jgi:M-phase phosphoprotein-6
MAAVKTVKESVSGRLSGLKFMQRAKIREEEFKKQEAEEVGSGVVDDSHWVTPAAATSRCKVIVEGDPKPGALIGRMSFQNCNPIVERIVEEVQARRERIRWSHSFFFCGIGVRVFPLVSECREATLAPVLV